MIHLYAFIAFFIALALVAAAADADQRRRMPVDRYRRLADHADLGCGADEFEGHRRFTRPTDKEVPSVSRQRSPRAIDHNHHQEEESRES